MKKFINEFKEFAVKGNVVDMAVGVIIGGAFGKIVSSLVNDVIMPVMGKITGNVSFTDLKYELTAAVVNGEEVVTPAVYLSYGQFLQNILDFIIVAFCIFCMVKALITALCSLAIIIGASFLEQYYLNSTFSEFERATYITYEKTENHTAVKDDVLSIQNLWVEKKKVQKAWQSRDFQKQFYARRSAEKE